MTLADSLKLKKGDTIYRIVSMYCHPYVLENTFVVDDIFYLRLNTDDGKTITTCSIKDFQKTEKECFDVFLKETQDNIDKIKEEIKIKEQKIEALELTIKDIKKKLDSCE